MERVRESVLGEADMFARGMLTVCLVGGLLGAVAWAAVTPEQKKEIIEVNVSMKVIATHIRK